MLKGLHQYPLARNNNVTAILTATCCSQYQQLIARFESSQKRHAQFRAKRNTQMTGLPAERARKIHREEKANMSVLTQQMLEHQATCAICKVLSGDPSVLLI